MSCQLPQDVHEYDIDAATVLRTQRTIYISDSAYLSRRIIGLPKDSLLYEGDVNSANLKTKLEYKYDDSGSLLGTDAPVQHDNTNYSSAFLTGRGNPSTVNRYDVTNTSLFTPTTAQYNTAGSLVSSADALGHAVTISYADSFSDGNNTRNTLAYPTSNNDPDGYTSTSKYNFDFGGVTYKRTPQPNTTSNVPGPEQTIAYDTIGRLQQVTNQVNSAYTRYEYPTSMIRVDTYATIQDGLGEAHSFQITDGAGRVIATAADHPKSTGDAFSGQKIGYDKMGRITSTSNPTETNASGVPS
jgi:hypothetical protein